MKVRSISVLLCLMATLTGARSQSLSVPVVSPAAGLTAEAIMARVAANQDRSEAERARFIYVQHGYAVSRRGKRVMCEETTDFRVTPKPSGSERQLIRIDGRQWKMDGYIHLDSLEGPHVDESMGEKHGVTINTNDDMDRDLVENLRKNLTDEDSKDGFHAGLFPLTTKAAETYVYTLAGQERMNGREVFHITFRPKDTSEFDWKGDAYIDREAFQPVVLRTKLSRNVPFLVRTMLGTSVPGLGFTATYAPQPDGTWFPVTFGTEFKINVLFFLHRTMVIAVDNREFEKTHASGRIVGEVKPASPEP